MEEDSSLLAEDKGVSVSRLDHVGADHEEPARSRSRSQSKSQWSPLRLMRPYVWPVSRCSKGYVCCTFVMVILSKICSVVAPLFLAHAANVLNKAVRENDAVEMQGSSGSANEEEDDADHLEYVLLLIGVYCLFCFLSVFCTEMQTLIYMHVKQEANVVLCTNAYAHVLSLSVNWHISQKAGSTLRILERGGKAADELIGFVLLNFIPGMFECMFVCLLFIWKFHQFEIFVIAAIGVTVYGTLTRYITSQRKQLRKESNSYDNLYSELASDSFANIEQVKCCNGEGYEIQRYSSAVALYNKSRIYILSATGILKISQQFIISATLLASLWITVTRVLRGDMNIGDFIAIHSYILGMFSPLNALGGNYNKIVQALVDVRQLVDLMDEVPTVRDLSNSISIPIISEKLSFKKNMMRNDAEDIEMCAIGDSGVQESKDTFIEKDMAIRFENVGFHYSNCCDSGTNDSDAPSRAGIENISFEVACGTTTAIVGSSGSGKTTLSRMMFRFYDPDKGRILFNDYDIRNYTQKSVRSCISLVPQDTILFNNTILHNIRYGRLPGAPMHEVEAACEAAQILDFILNLPNKWDTVVGERGMKLSGGEKQRVAIARCLLRNPPAIVLDEVSRICCTVSVR